MRKAEPEFMEGHIVTDSGFLEHHRLWIQDGRILSIEPISHPGLDENLFILPGWRDQHIHDLFGQQMAAHHPALLAERFHAVTQTLGRHGVTGVYLATFGDTVDNLETYCRAARQWMDSSANGRAGAKLLGIHLEGSFLNRECRGAQPAEHIWLPTEMDCGAILERLCQTGAVRLVNIVPDHGLPSLLLIQKARQLGLMVGSGHTKASATLLKQAYEEYGLQYLVHFTNGPTGQSFKPFGGGGAFEGGMNCPIVKELIPDGYHIDPRYVRDIIHRCEERWGEKQIIAVTDALTPLSDQLGSQEIQIGSTIAQIDPSRNALFTTAYRQPDGSRLPAPPGTLCGGIQLLDQIFENLLNLFTHEMEGYWLRHPALPFAQALGKASRLCSTNQALLEENTTTGILAPDHVADCIQARITKGPDRWKLQIQQVWVEGIAIL
ncbi:MAG: hypothetical protein RBU29_12705 [bacterium]|jgi:N-acetylglucosamine-6-phosphate deacetylase|nr:hypothetical protein [bacterium]